MRFSVIIPNWNGKKLLEKNLPAVLAARADEVVVVDDGSTDGSVEWLKKFGAREKNDEQGGKNSPIAHTSCPISLAVNKKNLGFSRAVNRGVKQVSGDIVALLNNDVVPERDFLQPLKQDFLKTEVFAVSFSEPQWSWAKGIWKNGFVEHEPGPKTDKPHISFWASGGSAAFRKSIWDELGGFDEIYAPFYWEDIDLSYRAWKRGYQILWEPRSVVHHQHGATIDTRFSKSYRDYISQRNQLLFIWKNITDPKMMLEHQLYLGKRLLSNPGYWKPFLGAKIKMLPILPRWLKEFNERKVSDKEVFNKFATKAS